MPSRYTPIATPTTCSPTHASFGNKMSASWFSNGAHAAGAGDVLAPATTRMVARCCARTGAHGHQRTDWAIHCHDYCDDAEDVEVGSTHPQHERGHEQWLERNLLPCLLLQDGSDLSAGLGVATSRLDRLGLAHAGTYRHTRTHTVNVTAMACMRRGCAAAAPFLPGHCGRKGPWVAMCAPWVQCPGMTICALRPGLSSPSYLPTYWSTSYLHVAGCERRWLMQFHAIITS